MLSAETDSGRQRRAGLRDPLPGARGAGASQLQAGRGHGITQRLLAGRERAADDALAGAFRQLDELLGALVLAALAGARVRGTRAVVLAGFGHAVTLFRGA